MAEKHFGFTIIEVIISLSLLCILSISFLFLSTYYMNTMALAAQKYESINRGEELADQVKKALKTASWALEDLSELEESFSLDGFRVSITPREGSSLLEVLITLEGSSWKGFHSLVKGP